MLTVSEWEQFKAYEGIVADAKREERERIIALLKSVREGDHWVGRDYVSSHLSRERTVSDYTRITDRKIELTDESVEELMPDYTPTTEEVRGAYEGQLIKVGDNAYQLLDEAHAKAEFDRWLNEVKAQAWWEGWQAETYSINPYRKET